MATDSDRTLPPHGAITWIEIPAIDLARVQAFYTTVFGWTIRSTPAPNPDISLFTKGSTNGSFVKLPEGHLLTAALRPDNSSKEKFSVRVTISVESVDETLKEVEKAGGCLYIEKREIPGDMGFVAYFTDTEKNVMGLWSQK